MTGQFETLIYTDCRPGQGLQGTAGFQFQARSPGVDGESMDIVRKSLLYEPPGRWMRERRPVEDYPPSLAHIHKGVFATSAGVYLGKETNGSREGNQLTHSIVTREPAAYGLVRPAQMFQAPFWRTQPAESTTCPTLDAGWEPGPFDAVRAQEFVRSQDKGADLLRALLSALQRLASGKAKARRILFVARDPVLVLRWLTAATLLMPQRSALRVGFKIFTANPAYADQQVLAVHPDWGVSEAAVDNDHGYTVFDLVRHVWSEVDSTAPARRWVALFLAEDPYDVVDAVEVTAATRLPDEAAATVAVTAVLRRKPTRAGAQVVASWLRDGPQSLVGVYGGPMLDLFVETAADWPPATLFVLDEATRRGGFTEQAARVRLSLLAAELELARTTGGVGSGRIPPPLAGGWGAPEAKEAADKIAEALRSARAAEFEAVLRVAGRFGLPVPVAAVEPAVRRFVADWAEHPERGYRSELWPCRAEIEGLLRGELERRLAADPERVHELGDTWWQVLLRHPMRVENSLDAAAVSAAMRHLAVPYRLELVRECLESAMRAPDVAAALHRAAAGLWLSTPPTLPEAEVLAELAPPGLALDSMVFASLGRRLLDGMRPGDEDMAVARLLTGRRLWVPETNMEHMLVGGLGLDWVLNELARQNPDYVEITLTMPRIGMDAIAARAEPTIERLLETSVAAAAYAVLSAAPILTGRFAQQLYPKLRKNPQIPHVVIAFVLIHPRQIGPDMAKEVDDRSREELRAVVTTWVARCSDGRLEEAKAQVDLLGPQWMALWRELVRNTRRARGWRRLVPRPLR
ncbi:hypothetical protein GCM10022251_59010 [Phytohabitans flavus]